MKTRAITIYDKFECMGAHCPDTCCHGWKIPVDDESVAKYKNAQGVLGRRLRLFMAGHDICYFRKILGNCPFHTKEGLCQLQKEQGKEFMPYICREYPRKIIDYKEFCEITLELSCPKVSELFLAYSQRIEFKNVSYEAKPMWEMNNDAPEFLNYLTSERDTILDFLWQEEMSYGEKIKCIYVYVSQSHELIVRNRLEEAKKLSIDAITEECQKNDKTCTYGFYSFEVMDKMIANVIDHNKLRTANPTLHQMIQNYYRCFNEMTAEEADEYFANAYTKLVESNPKWEQKYISYFSYYLQQCYLMAYEDYHILRIVMLGILYTQLLMIFDVVNFQIDGEETYLKMEVLRLSAYEKRIRHNENISKRLMNILRDNFLKSV